MQAWHVTERSNVPAILSEGVRAHSYWATNENLVDYYAGELKDPVCLVIDVDALDAAVLGFHPDHPSICEPITGAIGKSEEEVIEEWDACKVGDWRDSVEVVGSFVIKKPLHSNSFDVEEIV